MVFIKPSEPASLSSQPLLPEQKTPTPTPTPRRPALVRKRANTDDGQDAATPTPAKKRKVSFAAEVDYRVLKEWEKSPNLIREELRHAFERHARGDDAGFEKVKEVFSAAPASETESSAKTMTGYLSALVSAASSLDRTCSDLVDAILESPWLGRSEDYVGLYIRFLGALASARPGFVSAMLRMLVGHLSHGRFTHQLAAPWQKG